MFDVAPRFAQTFAEVAITPLIDPGINLWPVIQPTLVNGGREEFGERGAGGFFKRGAENSRTQMSNFR
jgi:hypothetical protein